MKILIKPSEILKRGLWDTYVYYGLKGDNKLAKELLINDEEFELKEEDGVVIGLLRYMETFNLIYRFNDYITDFLSNKSNTHDGSSYIRVNLLEDKMDKFFDKYPDYWTKSRPYQMGYDDLVEYVNDLKRDIQELSKFTLVSRKTKTKYEAYLTNDIKKRLKFKHY